MACLMRHNFGFCEICELGGTIERRCTILSKFDGWVNWVGGLGTHGSPGSGLSESWRSYADVSS